MAGVTPPTDSPFDPAGDFSRLHARASRTSGRSRSSGTSAIGWKPSVQSCASTSSPTTTRSARSAATSGDGSTRRRNARTTTSGLAPTTRWSCNPAISSSSTTPFPWEAYHSGDPEFDRRFQIPCAKVMGGARGRARAFRPASIVNVSGMSFGWRADGPRLHQPGGGVDFITIDGGEGGTGAGPLVSTDHVALPFKWVSAGFRRFLQNTGCISGFSSSDLANWAFPKRPYSRLHWAATRSALAAKR